MKTLIAPSISEADVNGFFHQFVRPIRIEDLLGREEIKINMQEIASEYCDKIILVTGAAGSIGSELCRQLAQIGVRKLILFDSGETPLHNVRLEFEKIILILILYLLLATCGLNNVYAWFSSNIIHK